MRNNKLSIPPPITPETTLKNARRWLNIVRYGESGTVIQIQDDCEYRVTEVIEDPSILKQILGPYFKKYLLAYIPIDKKNIDQTIHEALLALAAKINIGTKGTLINLSNAELLAEIGQKGYDVGLFLSHVTAYLTPETMQPLIELESLIRMNKNLSIIVFSEIDITNPSYSVFADKCSFLFDHIIKYPMYTSGDAAQFILHYGTQWKSSVPKKTIDEIIKRCGGYLWLIHQIFRHLRDNPSDSMDDATQEDALQTKVMTIWDKLDRKQKEILRKVHFKTLTDADIASHEYEYLDAIRFIVPQDQAPSLGIPLLSLAIEKELKLSKWHIKDGAILIGGKNLTQLFTKKEKQIVTLLINSKKTVLSRDTIAKAIWGENPEDKYSDWAIDRLIYRIRAKLKKAGSNSELVKTIKKKGFIFG